MYSNSSCNICGAKGNFAINRELIGSPHIRENILCQNCGSISRDRMLIYELQKSLNVSIPLRKEIPNKKIRILETSGMRGHPILLENIFDYYNIFYDQEIISQGNYDNRKYGDIQNIQFENGYFDVVLSSDVFEHVRLYKSGLLEVYRILKSGGFFLLQVPWLEFETKNSTRIDTIGIHDVHLVPPEYHSSDTLVYRYYGGLDLIPLLWKIGFYVKF